MKKALIWSIGGRRKNSLSLVIIRLSAYPLFLVKKFALLGCNSAPGENTSFPQKLWTLPLMKKSWSCLWEQTNMLTIKPTM